MRLESVPAAPLWALVDPHPLGPTAARLSDAGILLGPHTCVPRDGGSLDAAWATVAEGAPLPGDAEIQTTPRPFANGALAPLTPENLDTPR